MSKVRRISVDHTHINHFLEFTRIDSVIPSKVSSSWNTDVCGGYCLQRLITVTYMALAKKVDPRKIDPQKICSDKFTSEKQK